MSLTTAAASSVVSMPRATSRPVSRRRPLSALAASPPAAMIALRCAPARRASSGSRKGTDFSLRGGLDSRTIAEPPSGGSAGRRGGCPLYAWGVTASAWPASKPASNASISRTSGWGRTRRTRRSGANSASWSRSWTAMSRPSATLTAPSRWRATSSAVAAVLRTIAEAA